MFLLFKFVSGSATYMSRRWDVVISYDTSLRYWFNHRCKNAYLDTILVVLTLDIKQKTTDDIANLAPPPGKLAKGD